MELEVHVLDKLDGILQDLQPKISEAFPFPINVSIGECFSFTDKDIVKQMFARDYYDLTSVTSRYKNNDSIKLFFLNKPFFHKSIDPFSQYVNIGYTVREKKSQVSSGSEFEPVLEVNGTVDLDNSHLLVGGVGLGHNINYSIIFHELFHLLHFRKIGKVYENGIQLAHCNNSVGKLRCIMNPPKEFFYYKDDPDRTPSSTRFCRGCKEFLEECYTH